MSRFFVQPDSVDLKIKKIFIQGDEAHHVVDVMRLRESDAVKVFDGTGAEYSGIIEKIDTRQKTAVIKIEHIEKMSKKDQVEVWLAQALPKKEKMEYIIEKATELGVTGIIPMVTDRTIVRPDGDSADKKISRWRKIASEASKQCHRRDVPSVTDLKRYNDVIKTIADYDLVLFAWLSEDTVPLNKILNTLKAEKILVFIGPEGDFTPDEVKKVAAADNVKFVSLGSRVLKSDTAGVFVLSVLEYVFGSGT